MDNKIILPPDFKLHKYGVDCRLVNEEDSSFIISLRANKWLTRFIHQTDNDIQKQREWLKEYKIREANGEEYYFIYFLNNVPFGLNRIYNIDGLKCTGGSWICKPGTSTEHVVATSLIARDIMFELLNLKEDNFDVRKGNLKVQKFHKLMGCIKTGETEIDILYQCNPDTYFIHRDKLIKLLNLDEYGN